MRYAADELELLMEEYLAGRLSGDTLRSFEQAVSGDAELALLLESQREVDAALRAAFVAPSAPAEAEVRDAAQRLVRPTVDPPASPALRLAGRSEGHGPSHPRPATRWRWFAVAAAILLSAAGIFRVLVGVEEPRLIPPDELYAVLQNMGWTPAQVCNTPNEFAALVKEKLGQALLPDPATATSGIALLGWGYEDDYNGSPLSKSTMMLLTTVGEDRVLVLIDQRKNRRDLRPRPGSTLRIFEELKGNLVVYEITPLSAPRVLRRLSIIPD